MNFYFKYFFHYDKKYFTQSFFAQIFLMRERSHFNFYCETNNNQNKLFHLFPFRRFSYLKNSNGRTKIRYDKISFIHGKYKLCYVISSYISTYISTS